MHGIDDLRDKRVYLALLRMMGIVSVGPIAHGCRPHCIRSQAPLHTVAGPIAHTRLQVYLELLRMMGMLEGLDVRLMRAMVEAIKQHRLRREKEELGRGDWAAFKSERLALRPSWRQQWPSPKGLKPAEALVNAGGDGNDFALFVTSLLHAVGAKARPPPSPHCRACLRLAPRCLRPCSSCLAPRHLASAPRLASAPSSHRIASPHLASPRLTSLRIAAP